MTRDVKQVLVDTHSAETGRRGFSCRVNDILDRLGLGWRLGTVNGKWRLFDPTRLQVSVIEVRLRRALQLTTEEDRFRNAVAGKDLFGTTIPARTTLRIVDFFTFGAFCRGPRGEKIVVGYDTLREDGYIPRLKRAT